MTNYKRPTEYFDEELADMLAGKIKPVYPGFNRNSFVEIIALNCLNKTLTQRVELIADQLHGHLPDDFKKSTEILMEVLGLKMKKKPVCSNGFTGLCRSPNLWKNTGWIILKSQ